MIFGATGKCAILDFNGDGTPNFGYDFRGLAGALAPESCKRNLPPGTKGRGELTDARCTRRPSCALGSGRNAHE